MDQTIKYHRGAAVSSALPRGKFSNLRRGDDGAEAAPPSFSESGWSNCGGSFMFAADVIAGLWWQYESAPRVEVVAHNCRRAPWRKRR